MALFSDSKNEQEIKELKDKIASLEGKINNDKTDIPQDSPTIIDFEWSAPSRVFVGRDRKWFLKIAVIFLVVILLSAFLQDMVLILVLISLLGLIYVVTTVAPDIVKHEISNRGIKSFDKMYYWKQLTDFWLSEKQGFTILNVGTNLRFPSRLIMIIDKKDKVQITKILLKYLKYFEISPEKKQSWLARTSDGVYIDKESILFANSSSKV